MRELRFGNVADEGKRLPDGTSPSIVIDCKLNIQGGKAAVIESSGERDEESELLDAEQVGVGLEVGKRFESKEKRSDQFWSLFTLGIVPQRKLTLHYGAVANI